MEDPNRGPRDMGETIGLARVTREPSRKEKHRTLAKDKKQFSVGGRSGYSKAGFLPPWQSLCRKVNRGTGCVGISYYYGLVGFLKVLLLLSLY